jgi:hypothetical protein
MTILAHTAAGDIAIAATTKAKRVTIVSLAAIAVIIGATGLVYSQLPRTHFAPTFANELIASVAGELEQLDERWRQARKATAVYRGLPPGSVRCIDDDHHWRAHEIANRVEAGQRITGWCLQVRFGNE